MEKTNEKIMPRIKKLPKHEAHKIAAGEVVERPANIVKELLENAVDAGANKISLYIEDGGKKLIRVVDNGCGMDERDAQTCFEKHATSKLSSIDELDAVHTFGFRGEALASVAAVARTTLITKQDDAHEGICVEVAHNEITNQEIVPATTGTDIAVRDLFFNIPARKKFLKKRETEWRHIQQLFHAFCFDYPHIHFLLFSEGRNTLNCPPTNNLIDRCAQIWDHDTAKQLLSIETQREQPTIKIHGVVSDHAIYRYDRNGMFFFVNKRWVKNNGLSRAVLKAFQNVIPPGRYPLAALSIELDNTLIDVNIHPRKEEVKFMHPRMVETLIQDAVKHALEQNVSQKINRDVSFKPKVNTYGHMEGKKSFFAGAFSNLFNSNKSDENQTDVRFLRQAQDERETNNILKNNQSVRPEFIEGNEHELKVTEPTKSVRPAVSTIAEGDGRKLVEGNEWEINVQNNIKIKQEYRLIGQYHKTYLLIEQDNGLFLIDQHAAHERILYEQFAHNFADIPTVTLLFPELIAISAQEKKQIEPHLHLLQQNGIGIELFDDNQLIVRSTPVHLKDVSIESLIKKMIADLHELDTVDEQAFFKQAHEKLRAQMACKAAIKAGDSLTREQMDKLLFDLYKTPNRFSCPHGRPTSWLLRLDEIEKKFKRDYKSYKKEIE